ncbi:MAG: DNA repair protein RecN, partial [Deltaproteobacteria bacterium]|nr:DNA repair protein RecN [Deltaproteobacteria bacterium]
AMLISISGQHENQLLLRPENHLYLLDDFGGLSGERRRLNEIFDSYQCLKDAIKRLRGEIEAREEREELAEFQKKEIEMARLAPGEDKELEEERTRLRHAQELIEILNDVYQILYEKEDAVISVLAHCLRGVERGAEMEKRLGPVRDGLASARIELEDIALELRQMRETITVDPEALERVEERIQWINRLKRKYGSTIQEILDFKDRLSRSAAGLEEKRRELEKMQFRMEEMVGELHKRGLELSRKRRQVAKLLDNAVMEELALLDMSGTRFRVRFHELERETGDPRELVPRHLGSDGYDSLEFMLSPNIGEDLKPLYRVASGGELSRIMLALKTILARTASIETVVFDEVDSGIGGATAEVVGEKLQALARHHKVLCITHLPQTASTGNSHFLVKKEVIRGRTQTTISRLEKEEERIREIARLLGGKVVTKEAIAHAREMLG